MAASQATATSLAEGPVAYVVVEDRFGPDCAPSVAGTCIANVSSTDGTLAGTTVDAHHELRYIGVALDSSATREMIGVESPVPETDAGVDFAHFFVPYPFFILADGAIDHAPRPDDRYFVSMSPEGTIVHYYGPTTRSSDLHFDNQTWGVTFLQQGPGYDGLRLVYAPGPLQSDHELDSTGGVCTTSGAAVIRAVIETASQQPCETEMGHTSETLKSNSPSVRAGLQFANAEVSTNASHVGSSSYRSRSPSDTVLLKKSLSFPPPGNEPRRNPPLGRGQEDAEVLPAWPVPLEVPIPTGAGTRTSISISGGAPSPSWPLVTTALAVGAMLLLVGAALYSRLASKQQLLRSAQRQRLLEVVTGQPGVSLAAAASALQLSPNAIRHHAQMLSKAGLLSIVASRHRVFLYPAGRAPRADDTVFLRQPVERDEVFQVLVASVEGLTRSDMHALLPGMAARTRNHRLRRLIDLGFVEVVKSDSGERFRVAGHATGPGGDGTPRTSPSSQPRDLAGMS